MVVASEGTRGSPDRPRDRPHGSRDRRIVIALLVLALVLRLGYFLEILNSPYGNDVTLDVSNDLLRRQVTLIGSWTFSTVGQAACAQYVADRAIDLDRLFTHRWRLDQAEEAYRVFDRQSSGKGVIIPS